MYKGFDFGHVFQGLAENCIAVSGESVRSGLIRLDVIKALQISYATERSKRLRKVFVVEGAWVVAKSMSKYFL